MSVKHRETREVREVREDQHGTLTGYSYGCRCRSCTLANREKGRQYREQHQGKEVPEDAHGSSRGYAIFGCRCDACCEYRSLYVGERAAAAATTEPQNRSQVMRANGVAVAVCKTCKWVGTKYRRGGWNSDPNLEASAEQREHRCTT